MTTAIAYLLVVILVVPVYHTSSFLIGFLVALLVAWAPVSFRIRVASYVSGVLGVAVAVAYGQGIFHWLVGPDSFTLGPFSASIAPLVAVLLKDHIFATQMIEAQLALRESAGTERAAAIDKEMGSVGAMASMPVGLFLGLVTATVRFFNG
jgi:hypothetical protein